MGTGLSSCPDVWLDRFCPTLRRTITTSKKQVIQNPSVLPAARDTAVRGGNRPEELCSSLILLVSWSTVDCDRLPTRCVTTSSCQVSQTYAFPKLQKDM